MCLCFFYLFHGHGLQMRPGKHTQVFHTWVEIISGTDSGGMLSYSSAPCVEDYFLGSSCLLLSSYAGCFIRVGEV